MIKEKRVKKRMRSKKGVSIMIREKLLTRHTFFLSVSLTIGLAATMAQSSIVTDPYSKAEYEVAQSAGPAQDETVDDIEDVWSSFSHISWPDNPEIMANAYADVYGRLMADSSYFGSSNNDTYFLRGTAQTTTTFSNSTGIGQYFAMDFLVEAGELR